MILFTQVSDSRPRGPFVFLFFILPGVILQNGVALLIHFSDM